MRNLVEAIREKNEHGDVYASYVLHDFYPNEPQNPVLLKPH